MPTTVIDGFREDITDIRLSEVYQGGTYGYPTLEMVDLYVVRGIVIGDDGTPQRGRYYAFGKIANRGGAGVNFAMFGWRVSLRKSGVTVAARSIPQPTISLLRRIANFEQGIKAVFPAPQLDRSSLPNDFIVVPVASGVFTHNIPAGQTRTFLFGSAAAGNQYYNMVSIERTNADVTEIDSLRLEYAPHAA